MKIRFWCDVLDAHGTAWTDSLLVGIHVRSTADAEEVEASEPEEGKG